MLKFYNNHSIADYKSRQYIAHIFIFKWDVPNIFFHFCKFIFSICNSNFFENNLFGNLKKIFSNLLRSCSSSVNGFIYVLLCTACHGMTYLDKLLVHVWQIIFSPLSKVSTILIAYRFSWYLPWQKSFKDCLYKQMWHMWKYGMALSKHV